MASTEATASLAIGCVFCALVASCALPRFEQVGADQAPLTDAVCGLSDRLARACDACIRKQCCELARTCAQTTACAQDMLEAITPAADFSPDFDELLGCMQHRCEAECSVHWGCVDKYAWPEVQSPIDQPVRVSEFLSDKAIEGASVRACAASDPTAECRTGQVAQAVTDAEGSTILTQLPPDFDGFYRFDASGYLPASARWSEPVQRVTSFSHFELKDAELAAFAYRAGVHENLADGFDPKLGHLIVHVQDCLPMRYLNSPLQATGANVRITVDDINGASRFFYTEQTGELSVARDRTSSFGYGGAFNFPPYNIGVTAVDIASGVEVANGHVQIVAGGIGFLYLLPRSAR